LDAIRIKKKQYQNINKKPELSKIVLIKTKAEY